MKEIITKYPHLLHGGDYNPEQWIDCPQVLEEDIRLMKDTVGDRLGLKASGGIRTREFTEELIEAGADRIGAGNGVILL